MQIHRSTTVVHNSPSIGALIESTCDLVFEITACRDTLRRVAVAEARCATEGVLLVQIEEAGFTLSTTLTLNVLLTVAGTGVGIAAWDVVDGSDFGTSAVLATVMAEIVVVGLASVTLVTGDSRLALTLSLGVALEEFGANWITVT